MEKAKIVASISNGTVTCTLEGTGKDLINMYSAITKSIRNTMLHDNMPTELCDIVLHSAFDAGIQLSENELVKKSPQVAIDLKELLKQLDEMQGE